MTPDQYRREGAEAMREAAAEEMHPMLWSRLNRRQAQVIIRAIDADEVLAGLPPAPDAVAQLVGRLSFPSDWRDRCGGMNLKQQGIWSDGFRTCREQALAAIEAHDDH